MRSNFVKLFRDLKNIETLIEYYKQDLSASEIGRRMNTGHDTILRVVEKYHITRDESRSIYEIIESPTPYLKEQLDTRPKPIKKGKRITIKSEHFPKGKTYKDYLKEAGLELVRGGQWGYYTKTTKK